MNPNDRRLSPRAPGRGRLRLIAAIVTLAPLVAVVSAPLAARLAGSGNPHGKFQGECADCHSANAWKPARISPRFDHAKFGFPLEGAHAAASCLRCHASLDFTQERQRCATCHDDVHRGELGNECARCHTARSFIDRTAMARLHQTLRFPLTGAHAALECEDCHRPAHAGQMRFVGQAANCQGCHMDDFRATRSPDHAAGGFPLDCMSCHSTAGWQGARFDHARTAFPLTGAHRAVECARCHGNGQYQSVSAACASCHQGDYDGTTDPPHAASGFSSQCQTCHGTTSWAGATFDHDAQNFPIYSGAHANKWASCTTCHTTPSSYTQFTCFSCHPHSDQAKTDAKHASQPGYRYDSQACYSCHPRGRK
jgi:hypothetical protein